jgi:hypothetical protein
VADLINRLIAAIAAKQFGNITRQQLLGLGLSSGAIKHRIRIGMLHPVYRGVYAVGAPPRLPLQRAAAAVLAGGGPAAASLAGGSGMTLWGFWRRWEQPFEIAILNGDRRLPNLTIHRPRNLIRSELRTHLGIRVTTPARTLFDVAPRLSDKQLKRDVNNALHSKFMNKPDLAVLLERHPHHPTTKRLQYFTTMTGGPTLSDWEREFPAFLASQGLPEPVMAIRQGAHTPDASWPELAIVFELDSWEYHNTRVDFETDRDRDVDYVAADLIPIRITWERMIDTPDREGARLRKIVALRRRRAA